VFEAKVSVGRAILPSSFSLCAVALSNHKHHRILACSPHVARASGVRVVVSGGTDGVAQSSVLVVGMGLLSTCDPAQDGRGGINAASEDDDVVCHFQVGFHSLQVITWRYFSIAPQGSPAEQPGNLNPVSGL
jgi:hypothetical protein